MSAVNGDWETQLAAFGLAQGRANRTVRTDLFTSRYFLAWAERQPLDWEQATERDLIEFFQWCRGRMGQSAMIRRFASVKFLYSWLASTGFRVDNPCSELKFRLPNRTPKPPYSMDDLRALVDATETVRDRAMVLMLIGSGCRLGEMAGMLWDDVDWERAAVMVRGKAHRGRWVAPGRVTMKALVALHDEAERAAGPLWVSLAGKTPGEPLTDQGIYLCIRRIASRAGITRAFPRRFRTTMACDYEEESGGDILSLMKILGHAKIQTSQVYAEWNAAERALRRQAQYSLADRLAG